MEHQALAIALAVAMFVGGLIGCFIGLEVAKLREIKFPRAKDDRIDDFYGSMVPDHIKAAMRAPSRDAAPDPKDSIGE